MSESLYAAILAALAMAGPTGIEWKPGRGPKQAPPTKRHASAKKKAARRNEKKGRKAARGRK